LGQVKLNYLRMTYFVGCHETLSVSVAASWLWTACSHTRTCTHTQLMSSYKYFQEGHLDRYSIDLKIAAIFRMLEW